MRMNIALALYKKEMLDLMRDKKTIIIMILVPVFLYPLMMFVSLFVMQGIVKDSNEREYNVGIVKTDISDTVVSILTDEEDEYTYHFNPKYYDSLKEAKEDLLNKKTDVIIYAKRMAKTAENEELFGNSDLFHAEIYDMSANNTSLNAYYNVRDVLNGYSDRLRNEALSNTFVNPEVILKPVTVKGNSISSNEENAGSFIGMILPFLLIISVLTGAIYPAIDATAGERERGTLETVMTLPVKKSEIMLSKFMSVSTIAVFSALLNLISMFVMVFVMYRMVDLQGVGFAHFDLKQFIPAFLSLLICVPVFGMFTSAVSLCVCIFAKSFKEANNISSPILIIFMFAAMASILPTVELNTTTAFIPVTNIALLIKAVFSLDYSLQNVFIVLFSNLAYCLIMVVLMSSLFSSEEVLFGEGNFGIHLFEHRANIKKGQIPGAGDLIFLFAFLILLLIYSGSVAVLKWGIWGTAFVQLLILFLPLLYAVYIRCDLKEIFSLRLPKIRNIFGTVILWAGAFLMNQALLLILQKYLPMLSETSDNLSESILSGGFVPALIVVGLLPAIAEEAAFRGFLFGTLKHRIPIVWAVLLSAALFGLYHMNLLQFFVGMFMGIFMAYMTYRSESILPAVLFHMLNNTFSVIGTYYPELIGSIPVLGENDVTVSGSFLLLGLGILLATVGIFLFPKKSRCKVSNFP